MSGDTPPQAGDGRASSVPLDAGAWAGWTPDASLFELIFRSSPVATSLSRRSDGVLLAVNDAWVALCGIPRETALGRTTVELGHWDRQQDRDAYLASLSPDGAMFNLRLCNHEMHRVRIQTQEIFVNGESLLLVHLTEVSREYETEQALQKSNLELMQQIELHGAIEKVARVGHWTKAPNDPDVVWSPGLYELAGVAFQPRIASHEARGRIHPDDMPAWLAARDALDEREVEYRWTRADGQVRWLRTRMGRTEVAGNPQTDFGVVQDITAERMATQAQAAQLQLLQNVAARVPGIMFEGRVDADGRGCFNYVSEAVRDLLQLAPSALKADGWALFSRVHPDDHMAFRRSLAAATRFQSAWTMDFRVRLPGGVERWFRAEAMPQSRPDGSTLWHGFTHDVTAARLAEHELDQQHRMLEAVRQAQSAFIEADDKRQAFDGLLSALLGVTGSEYGFVGEVLYDPQDQPYLKTHAITNIAWDDASRQMYEAQQDTGMEFRNLQTLFGHALRTGEPVISNAPDQDPRSGGRAAGHPDMRSFLGVPVAVGERLVAMVGLANAPDGYTHEDVEFLQPLLGAVRQLVLAWQGHAERRRARLQFEATSALLAEKSEALQVTLDSISQGLSMVDAQGRVRFYNRRLIELLELPEDLLARQPLFSEVASFQIERGDFGDGFELVDEPVRGFIGPKLNPWHPDVYLRRTRSGQVLEVHTRTLPDGGIVRTFADVTSYVQTENALQEERQRLQWVLEATRPGIWELNIETGVETYNDRWAEMLGYEPDELQPATFDTWAKLVHPDDLPGAIEKLHAHWNGRTPFYECDLRMRHRDGRWLWMNDRGRVHRRAEDGRALYMSGTQLDIHDRVTAQEEVRALNASLERRVAERTAALERSMKDMEAISYSIAHDLRAPLRSVNGFAALVADEEGDRLSATGKDMFERIARSSRSMGQMISDMLEMLRVVRVELDAVPVDVYELARSVAEALAPGVPQAQIKVYPLPPVMGDATLLRQVLVNLMDNALKYSRHQPCPEVVLGFDKALGAFYLRDNGMGFDMAHAGKLFGLFQRLHAGSEVPGTGVGLAIVARIIERHGGRIWASASRGEGATFWWTLPLA